MKYDTTKIKGLKLSNDSFLLITVVLQSLPMRLTWFISIFSLTISMLLFFPNRHWCGLRPICATESSVQFLSGCKSDLITQQQGVLLVSILAPLLFVFYSTNYSTQLYADDTIVYTSKTSVLQPQQFCTLTLKLFKPGYQLTNYCLVGQKTYSMLFSVKTNLELKSFAIAWIFSPSESRKIFTLHWL